MEKLKYIFVLLYTMTLQGCDDCCIYCVKRKTGTLHVYYYQYDIENKKDKIKEDILVI